MTDLTREQRRALETAIKAARQEAEAAAADALRRLGVAEAEAPAHLDAEKRKQRNRLRAHARALGDARAAHGGQAIARLTEQAAYVQWHRLLFARFLVERKLLREETGATVSLNDCREIAFGEGAGADEWSVAAGFAAAMLPGVFPADDPVESLVLAPEHARTLRQRLLGMDTAIFQADDSLGWTYQFWRAAEKKAVNEAQVKIGAAELPAVTQLFTEPYMVRFLLHNTLGAWWAGKRLAAEPALARGAADEAALRTACALPGYTWEYLRFVQEGGTWRPAAGTFPGWPADAKALTVLDPCCGSGHFLTEALAALAALRRAEERLSPGEAVAAVLHDNLAGLEIDGRCVQIAAFNLALTGWRIGGPGAAMPAPNVAWVGAPPPLPKAEFAALANGDDELRRGLEALHDLFGLAPLLGSLIEPTGGDLADPRRVAGIENKIESIIERMRKLEPDRVEGALAARGMADATSILSKEWILLATNVPFLGRVKQSEKLASYLEKNFRLGRSDLGTAVLARLLSLSRRNASIAAVLPQGWLFQPSYQELRRSVLSESAINIISLLGANSFESAAAAGGFCALCIITKSPTHIVLERNSFSYLDGSAGEDPPAKSAYLRAGVIQGVAQKSALSSPSARMIGAASDRSPLGRFAKATEGMSTGDTERFSRFIWELPKFSADWELVERVGDGNNPLSDKQQFVRWHGREGISAHPETARIRGHSAWGSRGILIARVGSLRAKIYSGGKFDKSCIALIPHNESSFRSLYDFTTSPAFYDSVREIDKKIYVTTSVFEDITIDASEWAVDETSGKGWLEILGGVVRDPTQVDFHGHPQHAAAGTELHVALARLAGHLWPAEADPAICASAEGRTHIAGAATLPSADADGLLPLNPLLGERGLADRLRAWCAAVWGNAWTADTEATLISAACERANEKPPRSLTLDAWLRTHAARQHAKLFHDRPFLWWITDGRADGFMAVVHYHRLTRDALSRLAFHVLGDHLVRLGEDPRAEAARILQKKLEQIIEGEAPYDIFVRWKPLHEQPLGWEPDLDDGVRLNIRPFIEAGVLAHVPNGVHYRTDRGKDAPAAPWYGVFNGERRNDHHTTLAEKRAARAAAEARAARAAKR